MKVIEIVNEQLNATIEVISRGNLRGGAQWSTKTVRAAMNELGYEISGSNPDKPDNQLLQTIKFSGTRDEIIAARTEITNKLKRLSSGKIPLKFNVE